jgi:hypothetical protein
VETRLGAGVPFVGEDLEVLGPTLQVTLAINMSERIVDAKTAMLLQHARLSGLVA